MVTILKKWGVPLTAITGVFAFVYYFMRDFRFSDPDQYYHFSYSRHLSETWSFWRWPQVTGMGWHEHFVDKEFLFHLFTAIGYKLFGENGVLAVVFIFSTLILFLIYLIVNEVTKKPWIAFFATLLPLFSHVFVVRLMLVRAYLPGVLFTLLILYFLVRNQKKGAFLAGFLLSWSYHGFQVPLLLLGIWAAVDMVFRRRDYVWVAGALGLLIGGVVHPYFPGNMQLAITHVRIALNVLNHSALPFGPELEPYRTDNFLFVFRYGILLLFFAAGVLWLRAQGSKHLVKQTGDEDRMTAFFGAASLILFVFLFLSPRFLEYFFPTVAILTGLGVASLHGARRVAGAILVVFSASFLVVAPLANSAETIGRFKQFDFSFFSLTRELKEPGFLFNCEWWGSHYVLYSQPHITVLDALDPALLSAHDERLFEVATALRQGHIGDPYYLLKTVLNSKYVLCSERTPLSLQMAGDPRFRQIARQRNFHGDLTLYGLREPHEVGHIEKFEVGSDAEGWAPWSAGDNIVSLSYVQKKNLKECIDLKPSAEEQKKIANYSTFVLSGTGTVSIFKDKQPYLKPTALSPAHNWAEVMVPIEAAASSSWIFKLCPNSGGEVGLGAFLLDQHQTNLWCETTEALPDKSKKNAAFEVSKSRCDLLWAR